jgi:hypothetical protein
MEEREPPELVNPELDALLQEWKTPVAPTRLRSAVFRTPSLPWYRRWLERSIRVPFPIAVAVCVLLVLSGWQGRAIQERAREKALSGSFASGTSALSFQGFTPVSELRPRIIRSHHASN